MMTGVNAYGAVFDCMWGSKNLSFLDSPDWANHVDFACLDNSDQSKASGQICPELSIYVTADVQKIKMKILPYGAR